MEALPPLIPTDNGPPVIVITTSSEFVQLFTWSSTVNVRTVVSSKFPDVGCKTFASTTLSAGVQE